MVETCEPDLYLRPEPVLSKTLVRADSHAVGTASATTRGGWFASLDLVRLLWVALLLDQLLDRLLPELVSARRPPLITAGTFARNLATVLAIELFVVTLVGLLGQRDRFGGAARLVLGLCGMVLALLLAWSAVATRLSHLVLLQIESSFVFFSLACLLVGLKQAPAWTKFLLILLVVPILLKAYAVAASSFEVLSFGRLDVSDVAENAGETGLLIGAVTTPMLVIPRREMARLFRRLPLALALSAAALAIVVTFMSFRTAQAIATVWGLRLPEDLVACMLYWMALLACVWTLAACLKLKDEPGRTMTGAFGLIVLAGYGLERPSQLAAVALGLMLIVRAGAEATQPEAAKPQALDLDAWLDQAKALAAYWLGDYVLVNDDSREITRISGKEEDLPVVVRVVRYQGQDDVEVSAGEPPSEGSPALELQERPNAPESATFERRYRLRDGGQSALDEARRAALEPLGGTTSVWPGQGAKWQRSFRAPAPLETLPSVTRALRLLLSPKPE